METFSLTCQSCGASLDVAKGAATASCSFCGTKFGIKSGKQPDVVILDAQPEKLPPRQAPPAQRQLDDDARLIRHGANLLDSIFGIRSCLRTAISLVFVGVFFICLMCVLPAILHWNRNGVGNVGGPSSPIKARTERTDSLLRDAERVITSYVRVRHILPDPEEGNRLVENYHDEWGRPIRYELDSARNFQLRSAGQDGTFDTSDDLTESEYASRVADSSRVAVPPTDLTTALRYLEAPGQFSKDVALKWLHENQPELDQDQHTKVVASCIPLLRQRSQKLPARSVLSHYATADDAKALLKAAAQANPREEEYLDAIVVQLIEIKEREAVLSFLNHPSSAVRASVAVAVSDWSLADDAISQQCISDLQTETKQAAALERLCSIKLDEELQTAATRAAKELLLKGGSVPAGVAALDLLEKYSQNDVPLLIKVYENNASVFVRETALRDRASRALIAHPEPRVCLLFAKQLSNRHDDSAELAASHLKKIGPVAESFVWPTLLSDDAKAQKRACEVLRAIGTSKTIPYLEQLAESGSVGNQAKSAMLDIKAAGRESVDPATE